MKRALFASLLFLLAAPALPQNNLREAVAQGSTKVAWKIQIAEGHTVCCCNEGQGWMNIDDDRPRIEYRDLILIATLDGRRVTKLRMVEPSCPLNGVRLLENVTAEESLDFLSEQLKDHDRGDKFVGAIAMHEHPRVVPMLSALARNHEDRDVRRDALFWLGQRAGEKAAGELLRAVDEDPEDEVREHAVFAISQLPRERAVPILINLVKTHKRPAVRKRAIFWLTQTGDPRALDLIEEILGVH